MGLEELGFEENEKQCKVMKSNRLICFDRLDILNRSWSFIFIGWGGLIPQGIIFSDLSGATTTRDTCIRETGVPLACCPEEYVELQWSRHYRQKIKK